MSTDHPENEFTDLTELLKPAFDVVVKRYTHRPLDQEQSAPCDHASRCWVHDEVIADISKCNGSVAVVTARPCQPELVLRIVAFMGQVRYDRLESGLLTDDDWAKFCFALHELKKRRIYIHTTPDIDLDAFRCQIGKLLQWPELDVFVLDLSHRTLTTSGFSMRRFAQAIDVAAELEERFAGIRMYAYA